jgi:hypothetical protein
MTKRYLGNIITQNPTAPAGPFENSAASGVWSLAEALAYQKAGLWPTAGNIAEYIHGYGNGNAARGRTLVSSLGNQVSYGTFGDASGNYEGGCSSNVRGLAAGSSNTVLYFTLSTDGGTTDFGDRTVSGQCESTSNNTRGVFYNNATNVIDYVTIASAGNATDFGDQDYIAGNTGVAAAASTTRAVSGGGWGSVVFNKISYLTFSSTGNALDFGDLTIERGYSAAVSNGTRACFSGGMQSPSPTTYTNVIDYITIASTGNATDFGDMVYAQGTITGSAGATRGLFMGADRGVSGFTSAGMYYITIASTGNSVYFGDLTVGNPASRGASCCNATVAVQPS